jgi:hypothetical protein
MTIYSEDAVPGAHGRLAGFARLLYGPAQSSFFPHVCAANCPARTNVAHLFLGLGLHSQNAPYDFPGRARTKAYSREGIVYRITSAPRWTRTMSRVLTVTLAPGANN